MNGSISSKVNQKQDVDSHVNGSISSKVNQKQEVDSQVNGSISPPPGPVTGSSEVIPSEECGKGLKKFSSKHKLKKTHV